MTAEEIRNKLEHHAFVEAGYGDTLSAERAVNLFEWGNYLRIAGDNPKSVEKHEIAHRISEKIIPALDGIFKARNYVSWGDALRRCGKYPESESRHAAAEMLFCKSQPNQEYPLQAYNYYCWAETLTCSKDYPTAAHKFEQAGKIHETIYANAPNLTKAENLYGWAKSLRMIGRFQLAEAKSSAAERIFEEIGADQLSNNRAANLCEWGIILSALGRHPESAKKFSDADKLLAQMGASSKPFRAANYTAWGETLRGSGEYILAIDKYDESEKLFAEIDPEKIAPERAMNFLGWAEALFQNLGLQSSVRKYLASEEIYRNCAENRISYYYPNRIALLLRIHTLLPGKAYPKEFAANRRQDRKFPSGTEPLLIAWLWGKWMRSLESDRLRKSVSIEGIESLEALKSNQLCLSYYVRNALLFYIDNEPWLNKAKRLLPKENPLQQELAECLEKFCLADSYLNNLSTALSEFIRNERLVWADELREQIEAYLGNFGPVPWLSRMAQIELLVSEYKAHRLDTLLDATKQLLMTLDEKIADWLNSGNPLGLETTYYLWGKTTLLLDAYSLIAPAQLLERARVLDAHRPPAVTPCPDSQGRDQNPDKSETQHDIRKWLNDQWLAGAQNAGWNYLRAKFRETKHLGIGGTSMVRALEPHSAAWPEQTMAIKVLFEQLTAAHDARYLLETAQRGYSFLLNDVVHPALPRFYGEGIIRSHPYQFQEKSPLCEELEIEFRPDAVQEYIRQVSEQKNILVAYVIVMEFARGQDLLDILLDSARPLKPVEILTQTNNIADGLGLIHKHGWLHQDIKLENIFVGNDGIWKLLDLGSVERKAKKQEVFPGTTLFTPPEIKDRTGTDDPSKASKLSDLWSLSNVLFWALFGRSPHGLTLNEYIEFKKLKDQIRDKFLESKTREIVAKKIEQIRRTYLNWLHEELPDQWSNRPFEFDHPILKDSVLSVRLQKFFGNALAYKPENRYQNAAEFASALQAILAVV